MSKYRQTQQFKDHFHPRSKINHPTFPVKLFGTGNFRKENYKVDNKVRLRGSIRFQNNILRLKTSNESKKIAKRLM